jgi:hypothetical protein
MEDLLRSLAMYGHQTRLVPAEQILTSSLLDFETLIPRVLSDTEIENIESILHRLLKIKKCRHSFKF